MDDLVVGGGLSSGEAEDIEGGGGGERERGDEERVGNVFQFPICVN